MTAGVAVDSERSWLAPGRIVGRLFEQAKAHLPPDSAATVELDTGLANNLLALDLLTPELAAEVRQVLTDTAAAEVTTINAAASPTPEDLTYRDALLDLLNLLAHS